MNKINVLLIIGLVILLNVTGYTAGINDTGISKCADATKNSLLCPVANFPRQDAEYGSNDFDFTKINAIGEIVPITTTNHVCVKDNVTGLMWEVKTNDGGIRDKDNNYSFDNAAQLANQVNAIGLCGYNDWRVPSPQELTSIVDYSVPYLNATIDADYFYDQLTDTFWTNTLNIANSNQAWYVNFYDGDVNKSNRDYSYAVRLVRGEPLTSMWIDNGDNTITDLNTNLMWAKCAEGQSGNSCNVGGTINFNWGQALNVVLDSRLGGYSDWRLPNIKELQSLVAYDAYNPSIDADFFPATPLQSFWSASARAYGAIYTWHVNFYDGRTFYLARNSMGAVRMVRDLPEAIFFTLSVAKNGAGTVTSSPVGINCGNVCSDDFVDGTIVSLTAVPATGYIFSRFSGACSGTVNTYSVTMDADKNCTAIFSLPLPTVTTNAVTNVTATSATLNGQVNSNGATATISFDFGPTTAYGSSIAAIPSQLYGFATVTATKTGLTTNTSYNYRVKAVTNAGIKYGNNQSFKTLLDGPVSPPIVRTDLPTNVAVTSATLVGQVNPNGAVTTATFEFGKGDNYGFALSVDQNPISANGVIPVTHTISGLDCNTNYYYRVKAVNSADTSYGGNVIFKTLACPKTPRALLIGGANAVTDPVSNAGISAQLGLVYKILKKQGYNKDGTGRDEIKILGNNLTVTFNGSSLPVQTVKSSDFAANTALTQWVQNAERLVIYLIGHGAVGYFDLDQTTADVLTAQALDAWLDLIQPNLTNITVINESCHSGSFLPILTTSPTIEGTPKRILLASADSDQMAVFMANGRISYSQIFWLKILEGFTLKNAHYQALLWLENRLGNPQVPQLESDGDPTTINNNSVDLQLASQFCLGFSVNGGVLTPNQCIEFLASTPVIQSVAASQTLNGARIANLELIAATSTGITSAWAIIQRPDYQVDITQDFSRLPTIALIRDTANPARWVGRYAPGDLGKDGDIQRGFDVRGIYNVEYYMENSDGLISNPKSSTVKQNIGFAPSYTTPALLYVTQNQLNLPTAQLWNTDLSRSLFTGTTATNLFKLTNLINLANTGINNINPPRWNATSNTIHIPQLIQAGDTQIYTGTLKRESDSGIETQWTFNLSTTKYLCGDADNNAAVTIVDALTVVRHIIGILPALLFNDAADVDSNDQITIEDALNIAKYSIGLEVIHTCLGQQ